MSEQVANVSGLGLIGGSIARALRARGWTVHGHGGRSYRLGPTASE